MTRVERRGPCGTITKWVVASIHKHRHVFRKTRESAWRCECGEERVYVGQGNHGSDHGTTDPQSPKSSKNFG